MCVGCVIVSFVWTIPRYEELHSGRNKLRERQAMGIIIVGNSAAGLSALEAFRRIDRTSSVTVITKEGCRPYSRVLLPYYLREKISYENLFVRDEDYYEQYNARCVKGRVIKLLAAEKCVLLESGARIPYDKILVATGSSPVKPPIPGLSGEGVFHLWNIEDIEGLTPYFIKGGRVAVLGSGFVSLQGAWAALARGLDVTVVELMNRIMPKALDSHGAEMLTCRMREAGVDLRVDTSTTRVERTSDGDFRLYFNNGEVLRADFILVGTGVRPNIDFLEGTGIEIDEGVVVNGRMETSLAGVYAAGDVAQVPSCAGGKPVVHALWPTAVETGAAAGNSMALEKDVYKGSLNMNVTHMYGVTVASIGEFMPDEGADIWVDETLPPGQYLKIILTDGVPVGATCVGDADLVSTLGMLRPLIRERVRLGGDPERLKMIMAQKVSQYHRSFVR